MPHAPVTRSGRARRVGRSARPVPAGDHRRKRPAPSRSCRP